MTVELRPWTAEDAPALVTAYRDTPDLCAQFGGANLSTTEDAREYIGQQFIITEVSRHRAVTIGGVVIGNVGLTGIERRHGTAWASY